MRINRTSLIVLILGGLLVLGPLAVRVIFLGYNRRAAPPAPVVQIDSLPNLPPTPSPIPASPLTVERPAGDERTVLVDMAHFTGVTEGQLQPLAAALSQRGVVLDYWTGEFGAMDIEANFTLTGQDLTLPDQAEDLAARLVDVEAMIVVTSFTSWSDGELAALQAFVADGGALLIISDPDISGADVSTTNRLAQPFGVVFEDGYLYDRTLNDEHFTHVPMTGFQNQAEKLANSAVFLYGSRSLSGRVDSQILSAETTLNSLRSGVTGFTALGLASPRGEGYPQNVMALGDLDVLTEPFVSRHDNQALLGFVADFLAGSLRTETLADFPAYLGDRVILLIGNTPQDALFLNQSASLQRALEGSGRTLSLQGPSTVDAVLGDAASTGRGAGSLLVADYIYLADFDTAAEETTLFDGRGLGIRDEVVEVEVEIEIEIETEAAAGEVTATESVSGTVGGTAMAAPNVPVTHTFVVLEDGVELVAEETIVILRRPVGRFSTVVAVLADSSPAVQQGLTRLTTRSFDNCITSPDMAVCPFTGANGTGSGSNGSPSATPEPDSPSAGGDFTILIVDDGDTPEGSPSEADIYARFLSTVGLAFDEWAIQTAGIPTGADLSGYDWVIWSSGDAAVGGPDEDELDTVTEYIFEHGGVITISGRDVGFFSGGGEGVALADVVSTGVNETLNDGLPETPIVLTDNTASAVLLGDNFTGDYYDIILERGPASTNTGAPVMATQQVDYNADGVDDGFMLVGLSLTWLPVQIQNEMVANMYIWASGLE